MSFDALSSVPVTRTVTSSPPVELLHSFPLGKDAPGDNSAIQFNSTHVSFPRFVRLVAGYARSNHALGEWEAGLTNVQVVVPNASMLTSRDVWGFAEKAHALRHRGPWSTRGATRVLAKAAHRDGPTAALAKANATQRHALVAAAGVDLKLGYQVTAAAQDRIALAQLRQVVRTPEHSLVSLTLISPLDTETLTQ